MQIVSTDICFPIGKYVYTKPNDIDCIKFFGTGFFIGDKGYFLTAKHVLSEETLRNLKEKEFIGVAFLTDNVKKVAKVNLIENGPDNQDFSLGKVDFKYKNYKFFELTVQEYYALKDVWCMGFPDSMQKITTEKIRFSIQSLKGYITKWVSPQSDLISGKPAPHGYLLNFPIPLGMSGSPIFVADEPKIIGIALGSWEFSTTLWENSEYEDSKVVIKETVNRVIEFGLALNITHYQNWEAKIADGIKLKDLF